MTRDPACVIHRCAAVLTAVFLIFSAFAAFAQEAPMPSDQAYSDNVPREIEFSRFETIQEARNLARRLEESGYRPTIRSETTEEGKPVYRVLVDFGEGADPGSGNSAARTEPEPAESKKPDWSLLGRNGGNLHGSLTLSGIYTDNAFNTRDDRKSNFTTLLSPEIWLAVPRISQKITPAGLSPRSAGGLTLSQPMGEVFRTYQALLYYRTDIPLTSSNDFSPYGSSSAHTLGAGLILSGKRFSLRMNDQYEYGRQEREAGMVVKPGDQDRYNANRFNAGVSYDSLNLLRFNVEYANFIADYRSSLSDTRDRTDNNLIITAYYRISPRMNLLAEYQYYDISYDEEDTLDSKEHYVFGGLQWDVTAKTKGIIKLGYSDKRFGTSSDRHSSLSYEAQIDYRLTAKTSLSVSAYQRTEETDVSGTAYSLASGARARLQHMLTSKITTGLLFSYTQDHYKGTPLDPTEGTSIKDDIYQAGIDFQYAFKRWLKTRIGYLYTTKTSTVPSLEYNTNMYFFMITGSI